MAPPKKKQRTSPVTTAAESTPAATPSQAKANTTAEPSTPVTAFVPDPWTPAQETALFKLLIHHKPTGIHKHFNMLSIYNSLQSQGLTHTRPSKNAPVVPIEHMLPQRIWDKLRGLYDLETLDEREEHYRISNTSRSASEETDQPDNADSEQDEWQFSREFALDRVTGNATNTEQAEEFTEKMFARRLKSGSEPASSPPLEDRSTPSVRGSGARGRGGAKGLRNSLRQSGPTAGRRGSRATTTTASTAGDDDEHVEEGSVEADVEEGKPSRSTRGSVREKSKRGKGARKKG